jgi:hypothetical protein
LKIKDNNVRKERTIDTFQQINAMSIYIGMEGSILEWVVTLLDGTQYWPANLGVKFSGIFSITQPQWRGGTPRLSLLVY